MPESDFGKYPANTPWDEGPLSEMKDQESWTLKLTFAQEIKNEIVRFALPMLNGHT